MGGRSYKRGSYGSRHPTATGIHNRYQRRLMSQNRTRASIHGPGFRRGHGNNGNGNNGNGNNRTFRHGRNGRNRTFRNANRKSLIGGFFEKFASEIKKIAK